MRTIEPTVRTADPTRVNTVSRIPYTLIAFKGDFMPRHTRLILLALIICIPAFAQDQPRQPATQPTIYVALWFDTEDYLLSADDDASLRVAELLTKRNIPATFKIVGEKARVLEQRKRADVIAALKKHDIGYHSNFHSVHPAPAEYLAETGLLDGVAEFIRREKRGADDIRRIFNLDKLSCYGQPGSSWASQTIVALPHMNIAPVYLDAGNHVGLGGKPFHFAGGLNVYYMNPNQTRMDLHEPNAEAPAKENVSKIATRLSSSGGGLISIFYHPCEWVHVQFWDGVNFSRGANPPRKLWRPPQQRTREETDAAFARFERYVDHIKSIPNVRFVTASDLPKLYPDLTRSQRVPPEHIKELANRIHSAEPPAIDYQMIGDRAYSAADQFELLVESITAHLNGEKHPDLRTTNLLGPDSPPPAPRNAAKMDITWDAFLQALSDTRDYLRHHKRIPARIFFGADAITPADFLTCLAAVHTLQHEVLINPDDLTISLNTKFLPERHIAKDTPGLFGGWVIHKDAFRAPKILEVARLQAWTLKPAILKPDSPKRN